MKHKLNTDRMRDISNHDAYLTMMNVDRITPKMIKADATCDCVEVFEPVIS